VVARLGLPGGGTETEQGDEPSARPNEVAQLGAGQRLIAEVVVTVDEVIVQLGFGAIADPVQLQWSQGTRAVCPQGLLGFGLRGATAPGFSVVIAVARRGELQQAVGLHAQHRHAAAHVLEPPVLALQPSLAQTSRDNSARKAAGLAAISSRIWSSSALLKERPQ
jgi:hypothetical protein